MAGMGSRWNHTIVSTQSSFRRTGAHRHTNRLGWGKLAPHLQDILLRLSRGQSLASIAKLYSCSYQAIQQLRNRHAS